MKRYITKNEEETEQIAKQFAKILKTGSIVALHGDLGCGKTAFSRAVAKELGVKGLVTSPTFTIIQDYRLSEKKRLYHLDLYRINNSDDAISFGIEEFLLDEDAICLIEWAARISDILPDKTIHIYFEHISENSRSIIIEEEKI